ncbi:alpha/beta fold hydrolase [Williamsia phyllosphaerae]|uniref:alpha/beta fold hydrolase n=1 Tax=Williamsia phyllosphaerae TaxID=885042 RepID=UPI00166B4BAE|nr:alpha/beta hydrolase [Williamsia phyllosphaerae]
MPDIALTRFSEPSAKPMLVLGPSLGTSVTALWGGSAERLVHRFDVVGWDLPGHGASIPAAKSFDIAELAGGVIAAVECLLALSGRDRFFYAGVSVGGAVGLQLLLDSPELVKVAVVMCTGAKIGEAHGWRDRASTVRQAGTASMVAGSIERWFRPGLVERRPREATSVLQSLRDTDDESYALVCESLGGFDVRSRLATINTPVHAVAGAHDAVTPVACLTEIADGVRHGTLTVLDHVAHLAPLENPAEAARLIGIHCSNA